MKPTPEQCPCGSSLAYSSCCRVFHNGTPAPTAEKLMRSRYCAYALGLSEYLLATWHPRSRPRSLKIDPNLRWMGLSVLESSCADDKATVDFVAKYKTAGRLHSIAEHSRFVRENEQWFYVDGDLA